MVKRTFVAIAFPAAVREQLQRQCASLQLYLQQHHAPKGLRWVATENIHLTLRFLGETTTKQVQLLAIALRELGERHAPFALTLGGLGGFHNLRQPRVLWLGVGGDLPQLTALQTAVEQAAQMVGFPADQRSFSAHVTLARTERSVTQAQLRALGSHLTGYAATADVPVQVDAITHICSERKSDGVVYTPLAQFPLNAHTRL